MDGWHGKAVEDGSLDLFLVPDLFPRYFLCPLKPPSASLLLTAVSHQPTTIIIISCLPTEH